MRMRAIVNTIKHYVQMETAVVASAAVRTAILVAAVAQNNVSSVQDVVEGSRVSAVFIESWVQSQATAGNDTKFQMMLEKVPAGAVPATFAQMNTLMGYLNKKNVLFFTQGVIGDLTTQGVPVIRQWFKIPKSKQRFGLGDELVLTISANGFNINNCGFATFKEQR